MNVQPKQKGAVERSLIAVIIACVLALVLTTVWTQLRSSFQCSSRTGAACVLDANHGSTGR